MVRRILRSVSLTVAAAPLICFVMSVPVFAGSLVISPHTTELETLPGTTSSIVLSMENGLERSHSFRFLAPGEQTWLTVEITVPNDESLIEQKWAVSIDISCAGESLLNDSSIILVTVGQAQPSNPEWGIGGGIAAVCVIGAVLWTRWKDRQRSEWTTGLKTKHWLE